MFDRPHAFHAPRALRRAAALAFLLAVPAAGRAAEPIAFSSGDQATLVLELYTSQGCSSCPPADAWLSGWTNHPALWKEVVPVAFHVDYWDRLGWKDPFATPAATARQRGYARLWDSDRVYTPGFVAGGREWRGWRRDQPLPATRLKPGPLLVRVSDGRIRAAFDAHGMELECRWALLGFGLKTKVTRGENSGRTLRSDFVALRFGEMEHVDGGWQAPWPPLQLPEAPRYALAVWLSRPGRPVPIQAAGAWLPGGVE